MKNQPIVFNNRFFRILARQLEPQGKTDTPGKITFRLGLAVSKRVSKKAVERNRIKRQIRAAFLSWQKQYKHLEKVSAEQTDDRPMTAKEQETIDLIVIAFAQAADVEARILSQSVNELLQRVSKRVDELLQAELSTKPQPVQTEPK